MSYIDLAELKEKSVKKTNDPKNVDLSTDSYLKIAKKLISVCAPKIGGKWLVKEMLSSDDALANLATMLMFADWRWNPECKQKNGAHVSKLDYRRMCGIWAIHDYLTRKNRKGGSGVGRTLSLDYNYNEFSDTPYDLYKMVPDNCECGPDVEAERKEQLYHIASEVSRLLNSGDITKQQSLFLDMYYLQEMNMSEIANKQGYSKQYVQQTIQKALSNLRKNNPITPEGN